MNWQQWNETLQIYWPHVVLVVSIVASVLATVHIAMTKQDVKAAIGWVAVVIFSPLLGATFYLFAGINRIRQERLCLLERVWCTLVVGQGVRHVLPHDKAVGDVDHDLIEGACRR
ncbi:MAG: PLDc N-terminal domain-containing protein, partial [Orrella sp.]